MAIFNDNPETSETLDLALDERHDILPVRETASFLGYGALVADRDNPTPEPDDVPVTPV